MVLQIMPESETQERQPQQDHSGNPEQQSIYAAHGNLSHHLTRTKSATAGGRELNLRSSCSSLMQNKRFFCLISKPSNETHPYDHYPGERNFAEE